MNSHDSSPWHTAINEKLAAIAEAREDKPPWYDAWQLLEPDSSEEERLRVYQAVRDEGCLPEEAGLYLIAWQADALASQRAETELQELEETLQAVRGAQGLEEADPKLAENPDYKALLRDYRAAWEAIFLGILTEQGEEDMARRLRNDPDAFQEQYETGRRYFYGESQMAEQEPPEWLEAFLTAVAGCLSAELPETSLGVHYSPGDDPTFWELNVFARPIELLGGEWDGEQVAAGFTVDLEELRGIFERIDASGWDNTGEEDSAGPSVWIDGRYQGNQVLLRILGQPPDDEEPGGRLDVGNGWTK